MLVVVNQPHINDFKIEGTLSCSFLDNLRKEFGDSMKIVKQDDDEGWVNVDDLDWFKEAVERDPRKQSPFLQESCGIDAERTC